MIDGTIDVGLTPAEKTTLANMITQQGPYDAFIATQNLKRVESQIV